ncbi:MAG: dTDP-4-amino-4,6-dideoxygalactose transaminase [Rhodothermales bacterium]
MTIRFNSPHIVGRELDYIAQAISQGRLAGNGPFTKRCQALIESRHGVHKSLLTHSCTGALEMAAILADVGPGDEVIMPSFTFVSTANAFVLRGARPVFVDIRPDTLNLDEGQVEMAITPRTKAIVPVHYAGIPCDMDALMSIAERHGLLVIADAAQALGSTYKGRDACSLGHLAALSFHETKNIISGEGGALLVNDPRFAERAEIIWEKGTNRSQFFRGEVDKYTWVDIGSSFLPSELTAAFLLAQLEEEKEINTQRLAIWHEYHVALAELEAAGALRRPIVPADVEQNAHMYYVLLTSTQEQAGLLDHLKEAGIGAVFHYVPLHDTVAGTRFGRTAGELTHTTALSSRLIRLPVWADLDKSHVAETLAAIHRYFD